MPRLPYALATFALLAAAAAAGCAGEAPGMSVDAGGDDGGDDVDAAPALTFSVTGKAKDYFTGTALAQVAIATDGMQPELSGTTDSAGDYRLDGVPPGTVFYVSTSRLQFRPTRNEPVRVETESITADQLVVSLPDSRRQYTTLNLTPTAGTAVLFADLRRNNGTPLEGVPLTDIVLVDPAGAPVGLGPYFFGPTGDLVANATLATSTAYNGRARVGFLDVPPGPVVLKVTSTPPAGGGPRTEELQLVAAADGATLAATGSQGAGPGMMARTFTTDVYPRLQTAANGGLGCANCHTAGGAGAVLQYDLPVQMAYDAIMARPNVVVTATPADSLLLTKPLYDDPPNHPNATFLDMNDPDYIVFLQWIMQGAPL